MPLPHAAKGDHAQDRLRPFLREGALTHHVAQERAGAFILTPLTPSATDRERFQHIAEQVAEAEQEGLVRTLVHRRATDEVDLIFVLRSSAGRA